MDLLILFLCFCAGFCGGTVAVLLGVIAGVRIFKNRDSSGAMFSPSPKIEQDEVD